MNRPQKKKKRSPESAEALDPAVDPTLAAGDDRNFVSVDQAFKEAEFEDKVWLFWRAYRVPFVAVVVLITATIGGYEGYKYLQAEEVKAMQADYASALPEEEGETGSLEAFASAYPDAPLGGFALLQAADAAYLEADYEKAASLYPQAAKALTGTAFEGRVRLGQAITALKTGQDAEAKTLLNQIAANGDFNAAARAEATYHLAIMAVSAENWQEAQGYLGQLESFDSVPSWARQAEAIRNNVPELKQSES